MPSPSIFSYTLQDDSGSKKSVAVYFGGDFAVLTGDGITGAWAALGAQLDDLTDAQIIGGEVRIPLQADGSWKTAPVTDARLTTTGSFNFFNEDNTKRSEIAIPAIAAAIVTAGRIILSNAAVAAFVTEITGGFPSGQYNNAFGQVLNALADTFLTSRKQSGLKNRTLTIP